MYLSTTGFDITFHRVFVWIYKHYQFYLKGYYLVSQMQ